MAFAHNGEFWFKFGSFGTLEGELKFPWGIATDKQGNIIVADHGNKRVQIFDEEGTYLHKFEIGSSPYGVGLDDNEGSMFISDIDSKIHVF